MKRIISLVAALILVFSMAVPVFAEPVYETDVYNLGEGFLVESSDEEPLPPGAARSVRQGDPAGVEDGSVIEFKRDNYVVDEADTFDEAETDRLFEIIKEIREKYKFDVVVHTTRSMHGKSAQDYADDYFDYNGYGCGINRNGIILVLCLSGGTGNRDVYISGRGNVGTVVFDSDYALDFEYGPIYEKILPLLKSDDFFGATLTFLRMARTRLDDYSAGRDYNNGKHDYYTPDGKKHLTTKSIIVSEAIAFAVALIVAGLIVSYFKSKMKTNRIQRAADNYEKSGSMRVTYANEFFVRKDVTRTARASESSGSGGNHTSSSGASHSGGGGKF